MFNLNFEKIDNYNFKLEKVALLNLFSAWYILCSLKTELPMVDSTLAKIYFSEYGIQTNGLSPKQFSELTREYYDSILNFFRRCEIQRCENIIERFGKVGVDTRLPHNMTIPNQCKKFFLELLNLNNHKEVDNTITKEVQCLDSLLDSLIVNNVADRHEGRPGETKITLATSYAITPEQFASYVDIINNAVINLYRPSDELHETHEDWGTKFRRIVNYVKTLVFMVSRDLTFTNHIMARNSYYMASKFKAEYGQNYVLSDPLLDMSAKDELFKNAVYNFESCLSPYFGSEIKALVMPYSSLKIEHAICLFHNTNAELDTYGLRQTTGSDTYKFLCCQEFIYNVDVLLKKIALNKVIGKA